MLLTGPPGTGKTLMAKVARLLPRTRASLVDARAIFMLDMGFHIGIELQSLLKSLIIWDPYPLGLPEIR